MTELSTLMLYISLVSTEIQSIDLGHGETAKKLELTLDLFYLIWYSYKKLYLVKVGGYKSPPRE